MKIYIEELILRIVLLLSIMKVISSYFPFDIYVCSGVHVQPG